MAMRVAAIWGLAMLVAAPAAAFYDYRVTGVAGNDVLNIRKDVAHGGQVSAAPIIGSIPSGATDVKGTGVTVEVEGSLWRQVVYGGVVGWVAARYLAESEETGPVSAPVELSCGGTEPFWSMTFGASGAVREDPGAGTSVDRFTYVSTSPRFAAGRSHVWSVALRSAGGSPAAIAVFIRTDACSDGMSDFTYPIEFVLSEDDSDGAVLSGCCQLTR
jgi:uncharacterized membrane protein